MRERNGQFGGGGQGSLTPAPSPKPPPPTPHGGVAGEVKDIPHVLIIAGEASGDAHGARLVAEIRKLLPGAEFSGIGGEALAAQGVKLLARAEDLAVVGLTEVAERLPAVVRALREVGRVLREERPALTILIDFPDFNFLVARLAKWRRMPVMYYISPQVWAWRRHRVRTIARYVDRMVVIFPFEEDFYRQQGVPVTFVGHPFMETLPDLPRREILLKEWGLDPHRLTLALLPGSRGSEIGGHLPTMLAAAQLIRQAIPEVQFLLPLASTAPREVVEEMVEEAWGEGTRGRGPLPPPKPRSQPLINIGSTGFQPVLHRQDACAPGQRGMEGEFQRRGGDSQSPGPPLKIITGQAYAALKAAHLAVVASGTVTVEAALAGTPTVIIYRLAPLTYQVARLLIRVPHIGMANLLAGEGLFPELIQDDFTASALAREVLRWIKEPQRLEDLGQGLARVVARLGPPGASQRSAQVALELIMVRH
jgi:lipid-A-disaccharide synthase